MKNYFILAASALALASCSSDDFIGDGQGNNPSTSSAINFSGETGKTTRAQEGETAAELLNNNFVVYGYKTVDDNNTAVFDHYNVNYDGNDGSTESNKAGWEYVGKELNSLSGLGTDVSQTIKYWDYSASQYDFVAFSFGEATQGNGDNEVKATGVSTTDNSEGQTIKAPYYTLTGKNDQLAKCYIADRITAEKTLTEDTKKNNLLVGYGDNVQFNFRSLATKVTMGIYETIPGYSVKDVKFYTDAKTKCEDDKNNPTLYAASKNIPSQEGKGTVTVNFPETDKSNTDYNRAHVSYAVADGEELSSTIAFDNLSTVAKEKNEKNGTEFIGRNMSTVSVPKDNDGNKKYENVISGTQVGYLTLKVDYTLESIDGSGEAITVTGATAVVPAQYTNWEPNYAYTYIFKITDKTNGTTGNPDEDPAGLYPIVFDAVVTEFEDGLQETITSVNAPSITTYAKGALHNEYYTGSNIYVSVDNNGNQQDLTEQNSKLYTVTATNMSISEATVANCIEKGTNNNTSWTLSGADNSNITVTSEDGLSIEDKIDAADSPTGNEISGKFAKFTPNTEGTYVYEYTYQDAEQKDKHAYKVIIVKNKAQAGE